MIDLASDAECVEIVSAYALSGRISPQSGNVLAVSAELDCRCSEEAGDSGTTEVTNLCEYLTAEIRNTRQTFPHQMDKGEDRGATPDGD